MTAKTYKRYFFRKCRKRPICLAASIVYAVFCVFLATKQPDAASAASARIWLYMCAVAAIAHFVWS